MEAFYMVLTPFVYDGSNGSGYRGIHRSQPWFGYFREGIEFPPRVESRGEGSDEDGRFAQYADAAAYQRAVEAMGVQCEVIYCREAGPHAPEEVAGYEFVGFDICTEGEIHSIVVELLGDRPGLVAPSGRTYDFETQRCAELYFNSLLNEHKLFDRIEDVQFYLDVSCEIDEKFLGITEYDAELVIYEVYAV